MKSKTIKCEDISKYSLPYKRQGKISKTVFYGPIFKHLETTINHKDED